MARLERIARTLPPDESASVEKLRRLVATVAEIEAQEQAVLKDGRARETALRAEIDEFTSAADVTGSAVDGNADRQKTSRGPESDTVSPAALAGVGKGSPPESPGRSAPLSKEGKVGGGDGGVVLQKTADDPLAAAAKPRAKPALEGKALFALGLHRIESAHEAAAAERERTASRLSRLRLAVARRQREEDAAPGHAELLQYLLRFEELGRHSLERQEQLNRCRAERQTLALTRELLANQARLLETVAGGVEEASKGSKAAREAYLRQMTGIGVGDSLQNQTRLLDDVRSRRRAAERVQASMKEDRKRFLAGTKELADECYRYEALNAHLALMRR
ncbi:unnamed protein product [Scytosiphon promiscuus]